MAIITLTSDMQQKDFYVASVKGFILSQCPDVTVVDVSHDIKPFDTAQAAFVLKNAWKFFPKGTIHIVAVDTEIKMDGSHLAIENNGQYFLGADNGIFSLLFDTEPTKIVEINITQETDYHTFPTRDILAKAACTIALGSTLEFLGRQVQGYRQSADIAPTVSDGTIHGRIVYIDNYGNAFTNISKVFFKERGREGGFTILMPRDKHAIKKISQRYSDVHQGDAVAIFSSTGLLQIAINKGAPDSGGGAAQLLGIRVGDIITIQFDDNQNS